MTTELNANDPDRDPDKTAGGRRATRRFVGWVTLGYWALLFVSTHVPLPPLPGEDLGSDKVIHVAAFAGLGFLTALWLALGEKLTILRLLLLLAMLAVYGAFDEWLQQFVNRTTDFHDWIADVSGATAGIIIIRWLQSVRPLHEVATSDE